MTTHACAGRCWCSGVHGRVAEPDAWDLLDGAVVGSALWGAAVAVVSLLLAAVAAALLIRRWTRG